MEQHEYQHFVDIFIKNIFINSFIGTGSFFNSFIAAIDFLMFPEGIERDQWHEMC